MQKDNEPKESYNVSISDWITILQEKTSTNINIYLFLASAIIGMIIVVPQMVRETMGSDFYASITIAILLLIIYILFRLMSSRTEKMNKPYKELYNKIILGEITDTNKIREEYKKIKEVSI